MNTVQTGLSSAGHPAPFPLWCFDQLTDDDVEDLLLEEEQADEPKGKRLYCAACREPVCTEQDQVSQLGAFRHTFINPFGNEFEIGCFQRAKCSVTGTPSKELTWFPGYAWRIAACEACFTHLGWEYSDPEGDVFYGLILGNLCDQP